MRTEQEMMGLILGVAAANERVRAVVMNGSRADPTLPPGISSKTTILSTT